MTWKELKEHVNRLDENQLSQNVELWRDHETLHNIGITVTCENYYYCPENECCINESEMNYLIDNAPESYPNGLKGLRKVHDSGFSYLHTD